MRLMWLALILGCSGGYRAAAAPALVRWEQVDQRMEEARSKEEFLRFQARFPELFGEEDPDKVSYAFVQTERYVYHGKSVCPPSDPRLIREVITHGACIGEEAEGQCFQSMVNGLPEGDPCR